MENGNSLIELLDRLTPREFEIWSREYLTFLGYHNIILRALDSNDTKNIICTKDNSTFYVLCKNNIVDKFVTSKDVEKLLGTMITDNIKEGLIITTNSLSNNAYKLVANLPSPFSIHIIDLKKSTNYMNNYLLRTQLKSFSFFL